MLDRTENAQYQKEMALVTSTDANMSERVRYGQVLGADFILTGKIDVKTIKQEEVNPLTGQKNVTYSTLSDVTFNMIEIATEFLPHGPYYLKVSSQKGLDSKLFYKL